MTITNRSLDAMVGNAKLLAAFPFLQPLRSRLAPRTKPRCCGEAVKPPKYDNIKRAVAALNGADRERFKSLLGVDSVTVHASVGGKSVAVTF